MPIFFTFKYDIIVNLCGWYAINSRQFPCSRARTSHSEKIPQSLVYQLHNAPLEIQTLSIPERHKESSQLYSSHFGPVMIIHIHVPSNIIEDIIFHG